MISKSLFNAANWYEVLSPTPVEHLIIFSTNIQEWIGNSLSVGMFIWFLNCKKL